MMIDYKEKGKVIFSMYDYINKMIKELPHDTERVSKTPAANHQFMTNKMSKALSENEAQLFHHLVEKLLYLCQCTRKDIQTAVAFLCMRIIKPDIDDYKKLTDVMHTYEVHQNCH